MTLKNAVTNVEKYKKDVLQGAQVKICINGTIPSGAQEPVVGPVAGLKNSAHGQVERCDNDDNEDDKDNNDNDVDKDNPDYDDEKDDDNDNDDNQQLVVGQGLKNSAHGQIKVIYSLTQGCISCGILVSGIRARGVSSEHMENMERFSCSPT